MMRRLALLILGVGIVVGSTARAQIGPADESFAAGTAAFAEEDYLRALSHFQSALDGGIDGPAIHYNLAVSHYRLGDYERAAAEFALIEERYPSMRALAQYNLGLVARRQGNESEAEPYFREALRNTQDETLRALAEQALGIERGAVATADRRWYRFFNLRVGHDDNVRLVSDDVPLPEGASTGSRSTELTALVSGPITAQPGFRFDGSLYAVRYQDADFFNQSYLRLAPAYEFTFGRWQAEAGAHGSLSTLDGDRYENRLGAGLRFSRELSAQTSLIARYVRDEIDAGADRFAFTDGSRDWLELSVDRQRDSRRLTFSYALESNDRGDAIASKRNKIGLRYRHRIDELWMTDLRGSFRRSNYDELTEPRDEDLIEISLGVTRYLRQNWALNGEVVLADNDAPPLFAYDRRRVSLALSKTFF